MSYIIQAISASSSKHAASFASSIRKLHLDGFSIPKTVVSNWITITLNNGITTHYRRIGDKLEWSGPSVSMLEITSMLGLTPILSTSFSSGHLSSTVILEWTSNTIIHTSPGPHPFTGTTI